MALRPLTPQPPAYVAWEDAVTDELGEALEMCRSDAQGIVEVQADTMELAWQRQLDPKAAAALVIEAVIPKNSNGGSV